MRVSKRVFVAACPHFTLEPGSLDCGLVCYVERIRTGLEAGQGFWGDALIVVAPEYKGHWNKRPLQLTEWALCSNDKVQRLWENLFFFFFFPGHINISENHHGNHSRLCRMKWRFIRPAISCYGFLFCCFRFTGILYFVLSSSVFVIHAALDAKLREFWTLFRWLDKPD